MKNLLMTLTLALSVSPALAEIKVENAHIRAVPPSQKITAAFMVFENKGADDLAIISGSSDISEVVELHTHKKEGDKMMMRQIEEISSPSGVTTELKPGGLHLMLIGLKEPIHLEQTVDINLNLSNGQTLVITAPVKEIMPMMKHSHTEMHKDMHKEMHNN
jgi:copper(I)-binding protein